MGVEVCRLAGGIPQDRSYNHPLAPRATFFVAANSRYRPMSKRTDLDSILIPCDRHQRQPGELQAAYCRDWTSPANWWEAPATWFDPLLASPEAGGSFTNDINRLSSEFRDRHMVGIRAREVGRGERVSAVVGRDHVPRRAPAFVACCGNGVGTLSRCCPAA